MKLLTSSPNRLHRICFSLAVLASTQLSLPADALKTAPMWLARPTAERGEISAQPWAQQALTKVEAETLTKTFWEALKQELRESRAAELKEKVIRIPDGVQMRYGMLRFGPSEPPPGGRSLFISMHGGGNGPAKLNDSQWQNQIQLGKGYAPAEGIYVAPRAPGNTWDLWHRPEIDALLARLISSMVAIEDVNPDRVYLMGYSAGGDGVYQLAPRMSDRLAAASMMAGHPNETKPVGLRNVPFSLQVGGEDHAFKRNTIASEWKDLLAALQKDDPKGYAHFVEVHAGKGHWMDMADRKAVPWMEKFTRNPLPERIVWRQDDVVHSRSYWLSVPLLLAKGGQEIRATRTENAFTVDAPEALQVRLLLNDALCDLDAPVTVTLNGGPAVAKKATRTAAAIYKTLKQYEDPRLTFYAEFPAKP